MLGHGGQGLRGRQVSDECKMVKVFWPLSRLTEVRMSRAGRGLKRDALCLVQHGLRAALVPYQHGGVVTCAGYLRGLPHI